FIGIAMCVAHALLNGAPNPSGRAIGILVGVQANASALEGRLRVCSSCRSRTGCDEQWVQRRRCRSGSERTKKAPPGQIHKMASSWRRSLADASRAGALNRCARSPADVGRKPGAISDRVFLKAALILSLVHLALRF